MSHDEFGGREISDAETIRAERADENFARI